MRKTLTILSFLAALPAGTALAGGDCLIPMADWQPREAVARLATQNGWTVRRIKVDDGCYEIDGFDPDGREIEATGAAATDDRAAASPIPPPSGPSAPRLRRGRIRF